jgi:hypothetical protein
MCVLWCRIAGEHLTPRRNSSCVHATVANLDARQALGHQLEEACTLPAP